MAVPQPSLNPISSFDATIGTTIFFNTTGGDEIIRSSRLYIYDNEDGSLICTHIYTSTNKQHVLPPNTDSTIIYAPGKTLSDFSNEKQFRLSIQLYSGTNGTGNSSGVSFLRQLWCLDTPTLTPDAVNSPIAVTSYNFSAVYNTEVDDTSLPVKNRIQRYQFILYNSANQVVQTGNTIVGMGTQLTDTTFRISQNFTNLKDEEIYHVKITCTSEQGMITNAQSDYITVQIANITFNKAKVDNHCVEGYISITSNITNIEGETNITTPIEDLNGTIDLRSGTPVDITSGTLTRDGSTSYVAYLSGNVNLDSNTIYLLKLQTSPTKIAQLVFDPDRDMFVSNDIAGIDITLRHRNGQKPPLLRCVSNVDLHNVNFTLGYSGDYKYLIWDEGFTFPQIALDNLVSSARWTMELWGNDLEIADHVSNEETNTSYLIRLEGSDIVGVISVFMTQGYNYGSTTLQTRIDLLVSPTGPEGIEYYTYSNYIDTPTSNDKLNIWIRCIDGLYEVKLTNLG